MVSYTCYVSSDGDWPSQDDHNHAHATSKIYNLSAIGQLGRMSQMGLIAGGRGPLGEKVLSPIQTGGWGGGSPSKSPDTTTSPLDKRRSFPLIVDQRLDPGTLWSPHHDNDSRISIRSLQDDQDYSRRMLRIANPDH
ncbi:hypothetical protein MMC16_001160 [Acarospora aff. strigata]|nr:hypothetical protein [Acarospora aff. strigata]